MTAVPKPKKVNKSVASPQLTEFDYQEISEKISDAMEFKNEVEVTIYAHKRYESVNGIVIDVDGQQGKLTLQTGYESVKINMNNIVGVK